MVLLSSWLCALSCASYALGKATLGERDFTPLSADDLKLLSEQPDPSRHLDSTNPVSHLTKILIPRAREYTILHHIITNRLLMAI